jgi:hypothetical protein
MVAAQKANQPQHFSETEIFHPKIKRSEATVLV